MEDELSRQFLVYFRDWLLEITLSLMNGVFLDSLVGVEANSVNEFG